MVTTYFFYPEELTFTTDSLFARSYSVATVILLLEEAPEEVSSFLKSLPLSSDLFDTLFDPLYCFLEG